MWFHCQDDSVRPPKRASKNIITTKDNYKVLQKDLTTCDLPTILLEHPQIMRNTLDLT